jgi:hypothetical protein
MAVQKVISYVDKLGVMRTSTITIDLEKFAIGSDDEQVYLTVTAPGLTPAQTWRRCIDKIVEDGIYASGQQSRFVYPTGYFRNASQVWTAGTNVDWGTIYIPGDLASNTISGVLQVMRLL